MATWWDRIAIAFISFLFLLALLVSVFVAIFLVEYPEATYTRDILRFRLTHI
jgi:ABC-type phosphate transport system permease subunit